MGICWVSDGCLETSVDCTSLCMHKLFNRDNFASCHYTLWGHASRISKESVDEVDFMIAV